LQRVARAPLKSYCTGMEYPANATMRAPWRRCQASSGTVCSGVGVGSSGRAFRTTRVSPNRATRQRDASSDDPPLSRYLRDSRIATPYSVGANPSLARGPAFQRSLPVAVRLPERFRGPVAPSAAGYWPALSRGGCLGQDKECACWGVDAKRFSESRRRLVVWLSFLAREVADQPDASLSIEPIASSMAAIWSGDRSKPSLERRQTTSSAVRAHSTLTR
jgi:hypothetical protein